MNYSKHQDVLDALKRDQEAEHDLREEIDDEMHFLHHPQGQWEPEIIEEFEGRPRYTFDMCKPIVGAIWAEMAANEYAADIQPAGDGAGEEVANILNGMVRRMYNISSFPDQVAKKAGKRMIQTGYSAWRLVSQYCSPKSFYQDLKIIPVSNAHRRVWFDCNAELQTKEDADHVHVLGNMSIAAAEKKFGRKVDGLSDDRTNDSYEYKPTDIVIIGEILYKKKKKINIHLLNDEFGTVLDDDKLQEKLVSGEVTQDMIVDSRPTEAVKVYSRMYDLKGWLADEKETVFSYLPVIPLYANFDITEDGKTRYEGVIRGLMDPQRVFNYSESRKVEESVLAPRAKIFMDDRLADGYEDELTDINRDPRAVQLFNGAKAKDSTLPYFLTPGPQPNPAVTEISDNMIRNIQINSGIPNPLEQMNMTNKDSDFRFEQRTSMGQVGTFEYYCAYQVALEHTLKVAVDAFPKVYDTQRKLSIIDEAGQSSEVTINEVNAYGQVLNNISVGEYNVAISIGENFETRSAKTNDSILEMGKIDPAVVQRNTDIIANNMKTPGMKMVADRERSFLMKQGVIPESQWTDEEIAQAQAAAQQPQQPDPGVLIAQAELQKAQADTDKVQTQLLIEQAKLEQQQIKMQAEGMKADFELQLKQMAQEIDNLYKLAQTGKILAETDKIGVESNQLTRQESIITNQQNEVTNG